MTIVGNMTRGLFRPVTRGIFTGHEDESAFINSISGDKQYYDFRKQQYYEFFTPADFDYDPAEPFKIKRVNPVIFSPTQTIFSGTPDTVRYTSGGALSLSNLSGLNRSGTFDGLPQAVAAVFTIPSGFIQGTLFGSTINSTTRLLNNGSNFNFVYDQNQAGVRQTIKTNLSFGTYIIISNTASSSQIDFYVNSNTLAVSFDPPTVVGPDLLNIFDGAEADGAESVTVKELLVADKLLTSGDIAVLNQEWSKRYGITLT